MAMDQRLWLQAQPHLTTTATTTTTTTTPSLNHLSTIHSLITNPSTSPSTLISILQALIQSLSLHPNPNPHIFPLLTSLHHHHPNLPLSLSSSTIISLLSSSPRIAAIALSFLLSISAVDSIDDQLLVSLCFRPCVSVRVWFLKNVLGFPIRPNLLLTVLLGFAYDPYPCVRQSALNGLVRVCGSGVEIEDLRIVEGCFFRSVELLRDRDDDVRVSAVRAVCEWGRMLAASKQEGDMREWSDAVFLQVCAMVRDMNVGVKVEAFTALGTFSFVSEDVLLQTLSKKILATIKEKQLVAPRGARPYEIHASLAAGAFIHGLEDEFGEVQRAACIALRMLAVLSARFAGKAVDIITFVLNDDSKVVRLETLKTLHHLVTSSFVKMQEDHIDMLLGTLVDNCPRIRFTALRILRSVKLPDMQVFKMAVYSLLGSLDIFPLSEAEIFRSLFSLGQNHGKFAVRVFEEFCNENSSSDANIDLNSIRVAGLLVLAISASLKSEKYFRHISPQMFSYAVAFLGRISHAFSDVLDEDSLVAYLSSCCDQSENDSEFRLRPKVILATNHQQETFAHVLESAKLVFVTVKSLWPLVKFGCTSEVLKALRCCKKSLESIRADLLENIGVLAFAFQYIRIIKLLAKIWVHFLDEKRCSLQQRGEVGFLLEKLDELLLALRYRFVGLIKEDELYILELLLLSYVLKLKSFHISCSTLHNISTTVACVDIKENGNSIACSEFINQLAELSSQGCFSQAEASCKSFQLKKLLDTFVLRDFALTQRLRHVGAELEVPSFNSVSPLRFISGLPVGIPLEITLYNVTSEHRVWVKLALDEKITEFVFLDVEQAGGLDEVNKFEFTAPFYRTPGAIAFTLKVNIGIECASEKLHLVKGHGGPKNSLVYLCPEKELYFVKMN